MRANRAMYPTTTMCRVLAVTSYMARHTGRNSAIGGRTHPSCGLRGEPAGTSAGGGDLWLVEDGGPDRKSRHKEVDRMGWMFTFTVAAYNLVRIHNLVGARRDEGERMSWDRSKRPIHPFSRACQSVGFLKTPCILQPTPTDRTKSSKQRFSATC
ncbi:MAG: hypothetical protein ACE5JX_18650 [Acidobacteriota bacterium]